MSCMKLSYNDSWTYKDVNNLKKISKINKISVVDHFGILNLGKNYLPPTFLRLKEEEFRLYFSFDSFVNCE